MKKKTTRQNTLSKNRIFSGLAVLVILPLLVTLVQTKNPFIKGFTTRTSAAPAAIIGSLYVYDRTNVGDWSTQGDLRKGDTQYGDRSYHFRSVPDTLAGSDWIRTANDSKEYGDNPLAQFKVSEDATVIIAHNDVITNKPAWLDGYQNSGVKITNDEVISKSFTLYYKYFPAGSKVTIGKNDTQTSKHGMYTVVVKRGRPDITPGPTPTSTVAPTPKPTLKPTTVPGATTAPTPKPTIKPTSTPTPTPVPPVTGSIKPIRTSGKRFVKTSDGKPFYPSTHFLYSSSVARFSHVYFSPRQSNQSDITRELLSNGHNTIYLYTLNQGDYSDKYVTPYVENGSFTLGGSFDESKISRWRSQMQSMINSGLMPVIWLMGDDSPKIAEAIKTSSGKTELKRYISKMVEEFNDLPVMWVLGLEVDEYATRAESDELGNHLKGRVRAAGLTSNPVGIHMRSDKVDFMQSGWVDYGMYQYGFGETWDQIYNDTKSRVAAYPKPLIGAEYDHNRDDNARRRGLAASFANAAGIGNGAPAGLDEFMATLPSGMISSREGSKLYLKGSGITAVAEMDTLKFYKQ